MITQHGDWFHFQFDNGIKIRLLFHSNGVTATDMLGNSIERLMGPDYFADFLHEISNTLIGNLDKFKPRKANL